MKPQHSFVAERVAARHCTELVRRGPEPGELLPALAQAGKRLARLLAPELAILFGGDPPSVTAHSPLEISETDLAGEVGALAANSLIAGGFAGVNIVNSIDGMAVLRLVDRAFGGRGDASGPLPEAFPLSAELMIERLEQLVVGCLGEALSQPALRAIKRNCRIAELAPFPAGARLAVLPIEICEGASKPWRLLIAAPLVHLPRLLGEREARTARATGAADPAAQPFADVPMPLTATLVDMRMPLAALAALGPGAMLPVAVARTVPISLGGAVIARGVIGAEDDRVAIKLTQIA